MARSAGEKWGRCPSGSDYESRQVEVKLTVEGRVIVLRDVFQGVCPDDGGRVYKAEQLARIEDTMRGAPLDRRLNSVRV